MSVLCAGFAACDIDDGNGIAPVRVNGEVSAFLDEHVGLLASSALGVLIDEDRMRYYDKECAMINSADELPKFDWNNDPVEWPFIDFESHTLVVGRYTAGHSLVYLARQSVDPRPEGAVLNLVIAEKEGIHFNIIEERLFWGLYPKIESESIRSNFIDK